MSAVSPKDQILAMVQPMIMTATAYKTHLEEIDSVLQRPTPQARSQELQNQMIQIHNLHKAALEQHKANLLGEVDLGKRVIADITACCDANELQKIGAILAKFQTEFDALLAARKNIHEDASNYEGQMVSLLPENTILK